MNAPAILVFGIVAEMATLLSWRGWRDGCSLNLFFAPWWRVVRRVDTPKSYWFWWTYIAATGSVAWILTVDGIRLLMMRREFAPVLLIVVVLSLVAAGFFLFPRAMSTMWSDGRTPHDLRHDAAMRSIYQALGDEAATHPDRDCLMELASCRDIAFLERVATHLASQLRPRNLRLAIDATTAKFAPSRNDSAVAEVSDRQLD